jgi:uncharacterized membrane protein
MRTRFRESGASFEANRMKFRLSIAAEYGIVVVLGSVLLALIVIDARNLGNPLGVLRLLLGLLFVLLLPGYFAQAALFPEKTRLDGPERIALSLVLSIALIPLVALFLDSMPQGLRFENILIAQSAVVVITGMIAAMRRLFVIPEERFTLQLAFSKPQWWEEQDQTVKRLMMVVLGGLVVVAGASLIIIVAPRPSEYFTEFYLLGADGLAQGFPSRLQAHETATVTVGVRNHENEPVRYHVEVWQDDTILGQLEAFEVRPNEQIEKNLSFELEETRTDIEVLFLLFREGVDEPYRTLRLWVNVG